eukprot:356761-Chlamydomonas_euryale.AAC.7
MVLPPCIAAHAALLRVPRRGKGHAGRPVSLAIVPSLDSGKVGQDDSDGACTPRGCHSPSRKCRRTRKVLGMHPVHVRSQGPQGERASGRSDSIGRRSR